MRFLCVFMVLLLLCGCSSPSEDLESLDIATDVSSDVATTANVAIPRLAALQWQPVQIPTAYVGSEGYVYLSKVGNTVDSAVRSVNKIIDGNNLASVPNVQLDEVIEPLTGLAWVDYMAGCFQTLLLVCESLDALKDDSTFSLTPEVQSLVSALMLFANKYVTLIDNAEWDHLLGVQSELSQLDAVLAEIRVAYAHRVSILDIGVLDTDLVPAESVLPDEDMDLPDDVVTDVDNSEASVGADVDGASDEVEDINGDIDINDGDIDESAWD